MGFAESGESLFFLNISYRGILYIWDFIYDNLKYIPLWAATIYKEYHFSSKFKRVH